MYPIGYTWVVEVKETDAYRRWFHRLRDAQARARIDAYIRKIQLYGSLSGDFKSVGEKLVELRFDVGPGYRVYVYVEGTVLMILLGGTDKSTQQRDIDRAKELAKELRT